MNDQQLFNDTMIPPYEHPPPWIPLHLRKNNPSYDNDLRHFLPRKIVLRRAHKDESLGFNVRGGESTVTGIFISGVKPGSDAERFGLREADQILEVNGINYENIDHATAVSVLKSSSEVSIIVRYFPFGYRRTYDDVISGPLIQR